LAWFMLFVAMFQRRPTDKTAKPLLLNHHNTWALQYYDQEMTGNLDSKIIHMIPMYKLKWRENVVPLCIYSYVQLWVIEG
jgi:hypothetical protein